MILKFITSRSMKVKFLPFFGDRDHLQVSDAVENWRGHHITNEANGDNVSTLHKCAWRRYVSRWPWIIAGIPEKKVIVEIYHNGSLLKVFLPLEWASSPLINWSTLKRSKINQFDENITGEYKISIWLISLNYISTNPLTLTFKNILWAISLGHSFVGQMFLWTYHKYKFFKRYSMCKLSKKRPHVVEPIHE